MYGKVFESIFDSTLIADGGWLPTYIFMSMVAIADKDGYVEIAPKNLYSKLGFRDYDNKITSKDFDAALSYLCDVDSYSKSIDFDGRRIIPISELPDIEGARGWWIVNYAKYRNLASKEDRGNQSTERSRRWRERGKVNKINGGTQGDARGRRGRHTDTDTDIKNTMCSFEHFPEFWEHYPTKRNKKKSLEIWKRKKLDKKAGMIISDVRLRQEQDEQWRRGFIPHPTTYLNGERWEDEIAGTTDEVIH